MYLLSYNKTKYEIKQNLGENSDTKTNYYLCACENETTLYFAKVLNYKEIIDKKLCAGMIEIFENEERVLKKIKDCTKKVPNLKESWNDKKRGQFVLIMTKMPGVSLREWLKKYPASNLSAKDVSVRICIIVQLCEIMKSISNKYPSIVHRDLKPENIYIHYDKKNKRWVVYVIDFGCAILNHIRNVGTLAYQSPEQKVLRGTGVEICMKTDLFAIGQILFELLIGKVPVIGEDYVYIARKEEWVSVPELPEELANLKGMDRVYDLMLKMTKLKAEERPNYERVIMGLKNVRIS